MTFSIIIPAHNSAGFIRKALDSVKCQTYTDYELIVVCDSCVDKTEEIAREYTNNVIITDFHSDGPARNVGLDAASGDWILHMDDDDWWLHEYVLEQLAGRVGKQDEDLLRFSFIWKCKSYTSCGDYFAVWNKCWRREFFKDVRFDYLPKNNDVPYHRKAMALNPKIADWDMPMYYYNYMRTGSLSWKQKNGIL